VALLILWSIGLLTGLLIGLALGLTGAGGSLVAVPLLILLLGMPPAEATGLSLAGVLVGALAGLVPALFHRTGRQSILVGPGLILLVVGAIFAPIGRGLAPQLPDTLLMLSFALLSMMIAVSMWHRASSGGNQAQTLRAHLGDPVSSAQSCLCPLSETAYFQWRPKCVLALVVGGAVVGVLSGLYGVGGGFLIVPLLLLLSGVAMPVAVVTSLLVISGVSAVGFVSWVQLSADVNVSSLLQVTLGSVLGMWLANRIGQRMAGARLQKTFALMVVLLSIIMLATQYL